MVSGHVFTIHLCLNGKEDGAEFRSLRIVELFAVDSVTINTVSESDLPVVCSCGASEERVISGIDVVIIRGFRIWLVPKYLLLLTDLNPSHT
jgi:hypothetical protein